MREPPDLNVFDKIPIKRQPEAKAILCKIPYAETLETARNLKGQFQRWCREKGLLEASRLLDWEWENMVTFYSFPKEHWQHIRTTNVIESPFAALRLRTDAAQRFKKIENTTAVIWKMLLVGEGGSGDSTRRNSSRRFTWASGSSTDNVDSKRSARPSPDPVYTPIDKNSLRVACRRLRELPSQGFLEQATLRLGEREPIAYQIFFAPGGRRRLQRA